MAGPEAESAHSVSEGAPLPARPARLWGAREFSFGSGRDRPFENGRHGIEQRVLEFHACGWGPVVVRRYRDGEQLVWEYVDGTVTRMERICTLPEEEKIPRPR